MIGDLVADGEAVAMARGGRGGKGNYRFMSPTNQEPLLAEAGEEGDEVSVVLELKLPCDVALVGGPNGGKSSLLAAASAAKPRIAAYPFTTTAPVLGVAEADRLRMVLAEMPGVASGAHLGRGLGNGFLRHAERAQAVVLVVDGAQEGLVADYKTLLGEMAEYGGGLADKPLVVAVNKIDLPEVRGRLKEQKEALEKAVGGEVLSLSAATGEGVSSLLEQLAALLRERPEASRQEEQVGVGPPAAPRERSRGEELRVWREEGAFMVECAAAERLTVMVNLQNWRARMQLHGELERLGVLGALRKLGVAPGDTVRIGSMEMEWQ